LRSGCRVCVCAVCPKSYTEVEAYTTTLKQLCDEMNEINFDIINCFTSFTY